MTTSRIGTSTWTIDPAHSIAEFAAKHLMVATVKGRFKDLSGRLHIDEHHPGESWVEARIGVASVDSGVEERDAHLRSDDFFNAERFPHITFESKRVERVGEDEWKVIGDLTIRDLTKEVVLETEYDGQTTDMMGKTRAAFTAQTSVNRKEFGLRYNAVVESGVFVVGDKVKITLHIAAVRED